MKEISLIAILSALQLNAQAPVINATGGVRNSASNVVASNDLIDYEPNASIVPQMLVSIFGQNLAQSTASASTVPLPTQVAGTSVSFNGFAAPLLYVSPTQINAQVPSALVGAASAAVVVSTGSGTSAPVSVAVASGASEPGAFTQGATGCGQASALNVHQDGTTSVNTPANSFDPLSDLGISIFLTGLGVFPDRVDGTPWQFNPADNLANAATPPQITLANEGYNSLGLLPVAYAGPAPGLIGIDQINALLPFQTLGTTQFPQGCRVGMYVTTAQSETSQYVNLSVRNGGGPCVDASGQSLANIVWQRSFQSTAGASPTTSDSFSAEFAEAPELSLISPPQAGQGAVGQFTATPSFCSASYPSTFDNGTLTWSAPGGLNASLQSQNQVGIINYSTPLPSGALAGGTYGVSASGGQAAGPFANSASIPAPIVVTTSLLPGTSLPSPLTINWTGGDARSVVTVDYLVAGLQVAMSATADQGSIQFDSFLPGPGAQPYPKGSVEIRITQQPAALSTFPVPGLTLGGRQSWLYTFDYQGLTN